MEIKQTRLDMSGAMNPEEIRALQKIQVPDSVYDAVNTLIAKNLRGGYATINRSELTAAGVDVKYDDAIQAAYSDRGWKVSWDYPGYNESYETSVKFVIK